MNILCIDTSSIYASCALMRDNEVVGEKTSLSGLVHSKSVLPLVESVLESAGMDIEEIDVFSCVAGPGSFTGVRIGVCTVKGLAQAMNKPCFQVNSLDCLKENVPYFKYVCPILDARRGQVYSAVYEDGKIIREHDVCLLEDVLEFLKDKGKEYAIIDVAYFVHEDKKVIKTMEKFTLRKDSEGKWKILFWAIGKVSDMEG